MNAVQDQYLRPAGIAAGDLGDVGQQALIKAGVPTETDLAVTPGTGLALNVAAGRVWIPSTAGVLVQHIRPSTGTVTVTAAHGSLPRYDQVVATFNDGLAPTITVLAGVATSGATLDNRTGAATLAANQVRLWGVLVVATFTGPFSASGHMRDRRPWARGEMTYSFSTVANYTFEADLDGNVDLGYNVVMNIRHATGGATGHPVLQMNGDSNLANYVGEMIYQDNGAAPAGATGQQYGILMGWSISTPAGEFISNVDVRATNVNTRNRMFNGHFLNYNDSNARRTAVTCGYWANNADNIKQMTLAVTSGTMTGEVTIKRHRW